MDRGNDLKKFNKLKVGNPIQGIEPEAIRALQNYQFPGNVREMENIIERAIILARTNRLTLKDLGIELTNPKARVIKGTLDEMQKQAIIETLRRWEGNRTRAAEELGINRKTLLNKIKEYGLIDVWYSGYHSFSLDTPTFSAYLDHKDCQNLKISKTFFQ